MLKLKQILIFSCLLSNLFAQEIPNYYKVLKSDNPNIHDIHKEYNTYHQNHEWKKDEYFRAYREFIRAYKLSDFDEEGNPIKPSLFHSKNNKNPQIVGGEWKGLPVKIDRNDCYYTGQNGVVSAIDVAYDNYNVVYAGTLVGELFKSTDKGLNWSETLINNLPEIGNVNTIKIAPSNSSIVYAATDAGLIKSTNAGNTFNMTSIDYRSSFPNINYGGDNYRAEYMYVDVANNNPDKVVTADINPNDLNTFVAVSQNGGQSWNKYPFGYKNFPVDVKFHPTNSNIIYTLILDNNTRNFSFYKSTDSGQSFQQMTNGFPVNNNSNQYENRTRIALSQAQPDLVALYFNVSNEGTGFYRSTNAGNSFTKVCCGNTNDAVNNASGNRDFFGEGMNGVQIRWATKFAISDTDPNFVVAATNRAPRFSFNQMQDWYWTPQEVNISNQPYNVMSPTCGTQMHGDIKDIIIRENDVWVANDGGLVLSENKGETFTERADGIPVTMALGFDMTQDRRDVIVAAMDHNGVIVRDQTIYGENWKPMGGGDASNISVNPIDNLWLYGRPSSDVLFKRPETGPSHNRPSYTGLNINLGSGYVSRYNNIQFHPNHYYTIYTVDYQNFKIKKSTDNGTTWQDILNIQSGSNWSYAEVKVSHSNPDVLYVVDYSNGNSTLNYSSNGGQTWSNILPNIPGGYRVRNIEIDSENSDVAWLTLNNNNTPIVYKTSNAGASWTNYSSGLGGYRIFSIVHQKGSDQGVYVGTRNGVYYIDNTLSSWVKYGIDMDGRNISFLKINYAYNVIRAGTSAGIWENDLYQTNAPQANLSMDENEIDCGELINFADHSAASQNATYLWSFPGGIPQTSTEERPTIVYAQPGNYSVTLTVTDENGTDTYTYNDIIVNSVSPCTDMYLCNSAQLAGASGIYASSDSGPNDDISKTLDGNPSTHWHNNWNAGAPMPHTLDYDLGGLYSINGLRLLNRASNSNGFTKDIELYASMDNTNWTLLTSTTLPFTFDWQTILFSTTEARYFRIKILSNQDGNNISAIAEVQIVGYTDSDNDSICDFQDNCPLEYGDILTNGCPCISGDLKVFMEGAYDDASNELKTTLNTQQGLLPGQTPTNVLAIPTPPGQPYNMAPWNYNGGEGSDWTDVDYSADLVDWILVSLRTGVEKNTEIKQFAALVNKDGIVQLPTCALLGQSADSVYVVIEHRNHIGVMTPSAIPIVNGELNYDFSEADSYKDATSFGQKEISTGNWCMFAGDANQSDFPSYDINGTDKAVWMPENGLFGKYTNTDFDLDGDVNGADKALWDLNNGVSSRVPK